MPRVRLVPAAAAIRGGMDLVTSPIFTKPGTPVIAYNYEFGVDGGLSRVRGIEPFDGQPAPSAAVYVYYQCTAPIAVIVVGDTVTGATSGATGRVIYISGAYIAMTRVTGTFVVEGLQTGGITRATVLTLTPPVDGFLDNILFKAAADSYQSVIGRVPGAGRIRGLAILNDLVYAWRNNVAQTALVCYKSSATGWVLVPLYYEISFTLGSGTQPAEGATLAQGTASAVIKRVVVESGSYSTGDAAGRYITAAPTGGAFSAGAFTTAANGTIPAAGAGVYHGTQIVMLPGGIISHDIYNFTASLATKRLYGCDGVNREFEFDGDVLSPIVTGMGAIRATVAKCHKNYLFLAYRGSLQHSGIGTPYVWSAVLGAGELGTGDVVTNLLSLGGAATAASLMVFCANSLFILYGDSTINWNMVPLSRIQGAQARTAQDVGGAVALDTPGVVRFPTTQNFGNFVWDVVSQKIKPIAAEQVAHCSVFATGRFKYRIFLTNGSVLSGLPADKNTFEWSLVNYGVIVVLAEHAEINGVARTFYADDQGWVYEADVGRSFAGGSIQYAVKLHRMDQRSPILEKAYRHALLEVGATSACTLNVSCDFIDNEGADVGDGNSLPQYGVGGLFDLTNYDASYWDVGGVSTKTIPLDGIGNAIVPIIMGNSDNELSHTIYSFTTVYSPRKIAQ
jgi:hypothetical protein